MRKNIWIFSSMVFLSLFAFNGYGKTFANQYSQFELPRGWDCLLEGSEWVCQSQTEERKKEAIIILAAKVRGEQDSLDKYQGYLTSKKTYILPGGQTQVSEPKYSRVKEIAGHRWVDSLHLASEVPGFYTRYLATVKEDLGIAITFSVAKDLYSAYQGIFDGVVNTLKVFRQKNVDLSKFRLKGKNENLLDDSVLIPEEDETFDIKQKERSQKGKSSGGSDDFLFYIILGLAVVGFLIMKRKR